MSANESQDDSLYPIAVLIDELRNEDVQVPFFFVIISLILTKFGFVLAIAVSHPPNVFERPHKKV